MDDKSLLKARIVDLHERMERQYCISRTPFLSLSDLFLAERILIEEKCGNAIIYGGYSEAERKIIFFVPEYIDRDEFVNEIIKEYVSCIRISPISEKFMDKLTHRDYLGALMGLGLERDTMGDIVIDGADAYLCCLKEVGETIASDLKRIKNTNVRASIDSLSNCHANTRLKEIVGTISSLRLDNLVATAFNMSRELAKEYINNECVFVPGYMKLSASTVLKEGDVVSVRGEGKFVYDGILGKSKKDKLIVRLSLYC